MRFTKDEILNIEIDTLTPQEKKDLVNKYFPSAVDPWKIKFKDAAKKIIHQKIWDSYFGKDELGDVGIPYRFDHNYLLAESVNHKPKTLGYRVTDFSKWVNSLYLGPASIYSLTHGKQVERSILHAERSILRLAPPITNKAWELIYRDPIEEKPKPLPISRLTISSKPIWGAPDLVYKNKLSGHLLIIERKSHDYLVPCDGWPDLRAQLWAYAHIDEWRNAPKITLAAEIWGIADGRLSRRNVLSWQDKDQILHEQNRTLFELYGGNYLAS